MFEIRFPKVAAASADLRVAFKQPGVIPELCGVLAASQQVQVRQYAAVLLRLVDLRLYGSSVGVGERLQILILKE